MSTETPVGTTAATASEQDTIVAPVSASEATSAEEAAALAKAKRKGAGRQDWSTWPNYDAAVTGLRDYWYPVAWASQLDGKNPLHVMVCNENVVLVRDGQAIRALHDRCPHRGVPLSEGKQHWDGTITCPYHGWTFDAKTGVLNAVITDGPDSPICGKVRVVTYPVEVRMGLVWVFIGDRDPHPIDEQLPEEWQGNELTLGSRIDMRGGNWRYAVENGFDEGHAKFLHRTAIWRTFKAMPTWNETHIERRGRWIYRVQDKQYWDAHFPGVGDWSNYTWWKKKPPTDDAVSNIGNTGAKPEDVNPVIAAQQYPGFASLSLPGVLRIAYPTFIHYEFYVPVDADNHRYVGIMVAFGGTKERLRFMAKYGLAIRWLFHGQFSGQDKWMVDVTDAPPERLYRPDISLTTWRALVEGCSTETGGSRWPQSEANAPTRGIRRAAGATPETTG